MSQIKTIPLDVCVKTMDKFPSPGGGPAVKVYRWPEGDRVWMFFPHGDKTVCVDFVLPLGVLGDTPAVAA